MSTELIQASVSQAVKGGETGVQALIGKLLELPQPSINVRHIYGDHVYMRELVVPAGILLVGRKHRTAHKCMLIRGALMFFNADGTRTEMRAQAEFEASPGRKVAQVLEDMTFVNSWPTSETDVDTLERELFEDEAPPDTRAMLEPDGDWQRLLAEQGATEEQVRRASEQTADLCPFPHGAYQVKVGRSLIDGRGLLATADIAQGEVIAPGTWWRAYRSPAACRTPAGRYTNHAKDPNAFFRYDGAGVAWLIAARPIKGSVGAWAGEEITTDYRKAPRKRWEELT